MIPLFALLYGFPCLSYICSGRSKIKPMKGARCTSRAFAAISFSLTLVVAHLRTHYAVRATHSFTHTHTHTHTYIFNTKSKREKKAAHIKLTGCCLSCFFLSSFLLCSSSFFQPKQSKTYSRIHTQSSSSFTLYSPSSLPFSSDTLYFALNTLPRILAYKPLPPLHFFFPFNPKHISSSTVPSITNSPSTSQLSSLLSLLSILFLLRSIPSPWSHSTVASNTLIFPLPWTSAFSHPHIQTTSRPEPYLAPSHPARQKELNLPSSHQQFLFLSSAPAPILTHTP
ncbi:MAG: hypothetical protein JOS17DRAFT_134371 [Linnemannia elongata]|nr:MAG: hypothetical protein JOS17DRAFT_134371 [Linnemannia elongata]